MPPHYGRDVTNPLFQPRNSCQVPAIFGKHIAIAWLEPRNIEERQRFEAAYMQHAYCWAIRKQVRNRFKTIQRYAAATEQKYDRLARVLRGQHVLRLDDIGLATAVLSDVHGNARDAMARPTLFVGR